jgi:hypothetical protein
VKVVAADIGYEGNVKGKVQQNDSVDSKDNRKSTLH